MSGADVLLTKQDVADMLRVSVVTVGRLVANKKLACVNLGHRTKRFRPVDVERLKIRLSGGKAETWI